MKKLILFAATMFMVCSCKTNDIHIVAQYDNVLYRINHNDGSLYIVYDYEETETMVIGGKEYETKNYAVARAFLLDESISNTFYFRENAPDLLVQWYH